SKRDWSSDVCSSDLKWFSGVEELRRYFAGTKLFQVQSQAANSIEKAHVHQTGTQQELIVINGLCNSIGQLILFSLTGYMITQGRSEERRVGKECRWR